MISKAYKKLFPLNWPRQGERGNCGLQGYTGSPTTYLLLTVAAPIWQEHLCWDRYRAKLLHSSHYQRILRMLMKKLSQGSAYIRIAWRACYSRWRSSPPAFPIQQVWCGVWSFTLISSSREAAAPETTSLKQWLPIVRCKLETLGRFLNNISTRINL